MAKKMKDSPAGLYLVAIVGIVAVVGLVVLVLSYGGGGAALSDEDIAGMAYYGGSFGGAKLSAGGDLDAWWDAVSARTQCMMECYSAYTECLGECQSGNAEMVGMFGADDDDEEDPCKSACKTTKNNCVENC